MAECSCGWKVALAPGASIRCSRSGWHPGICRDRTRRGKRKHARDMRSIVAYYGSTNELKKERVRAARRALKAQRGEATAADGST